MSGPFQEPTSPMYEKNVVCPLCGHQFKTMKVRSRFATPQTIDSDFCPHYKPGSLNPNYYYVSVCLECGFAFSDEFSQEFSRQAKEEIAQKITARWGKRDFGKMRDLSQAIESYKLAIFSASLKREKHAIQGELCLRLAWIYRDEKSDDEERFLQLALGQIEESYVHSDFIGTSLSEMKVLYLAGELNLRLGQYQQAIGYFSKIVEHPNRSQERRILYLTRQQWSVTTEAYRKMHGKAN